LKAAWIAINKFEGIVLKIIKKKEEIYWFFDAYGCFLSIDITTRTRTMMIKTNSPAIAGTKY
jgi:hypothetical protein